MTISFVLRYRPTSVITIRQAGTAVIEVIILDTHIFVRLSAEVHTYVASGTFVVFKQLVTFQFFSCKSVLVTSQVVIETARSKQCLFEFSDCFGNSRFCETFREYFKETFAQFFIVSQLGTDLIE